MAYSGGVGIGPPPAVGGISRARQQGAGWGQTPGPRVPTGGVSYKPPKTPFKVPNAAPTNWQMPQGGFQNTQPPAPGPGNTTAPGTTTADDPNAGLDATYAANTATNLFNTNNKINALTTQGAQNEVALRSALAQLSGQQPYDQLKEMYNANRGGGLYSSVYGQNQGRIGQSYLDRESALTTNAGNQATDIAQQVKALQAEVMPYSPQDMQQRAASYLRAVAALAKDPAAVVAPTTPSNTVAPNGSFSNAGTPPVAAPPTGPGTPGSLTGPSIAGTFGRGTDWYKAATRAEAASGRRAAAGYAVHPAVSALAKRLAAVNAKGKKV